MDSLREDAKAFKRKFLEKYPDVNGITLLQKNFLPLFKNKITTGHIVLNFGIFSLYSLWSTIFVS